MCKSNALLAATAAFLTGVAVGFILSPVKGGVEFHNCTIGSNNSTSGRWFSPAIAAGVGLTKGKLPKGKSKKKDKAIPAAAETVEDADTVTAQAPEETTGEE